MAADRSLLNMPRNRSTGRILSVVLLLLCRMYIPGLPETTSRDV